ncbi:uncharacterized protein LOC129774863 isoform X2 [Toxorhynchites rutilus septentrionalis]|uniref:uncharacterized protein LOC129774863 isoform X2 n=1 Tax=Toxorhynchites rutilus septentrionalis TaxID=329112 RepID=UPI002479CFE6|nr:uncharacterized protein LOC129774863 isoform X2 [Toxorhynchites rutilus septentrionalis]
MKKSRTMSVLPNNIIDAIKDYVGARGMKEPKFDISSGSRNGDSYSGDVYRIVISPNEKDVEDCRNNNGEGAITDLPKVVSLIAKVAPKSPLRRSLYNSSAHFQREKYILDIVLPTFEKFQETRGLQTSQMFSHYPTAIASDCSEGQEYILLADLSAQGFKNFQRTEPLDYEDVRTILNNLAEFHAVSFAMKDQKPEIFSKIISQLAETIFVAPLHSSFEGFLKRQVDYAIKTLEHNPAEGDEVVRKRLFQFRDEYGPSMVDCVENREDVVICHGDCWISNILYRHKNKLLAKELKFLDWQVSRCATPVIDLSYFIFCCTDTTLRKRLPELLREYHQTLLRRIDELGSDGRKLFPFDKLQVHLAKFARFGFGMALMTLHTTCCVEKDLPDISSALENSELVDLDKYAKDLLRNPAYIERMTGVCRDMVRLGYL